MAKITSKNETMIMAGEEYFCFRTHDDGSGEIWFRKGDNRGLHFGSFTKFVQLVNDFDKLRRGHFPDTKEEFAPTEWKGVEAVDDKWVLIDEGE